MLPSRTDPRWRTLVEHPEEHSFEFLALRILMQKILRRNGADEGSIEASADEVFQMFRENERLMERDIRAVFGGPEGERASGNLLTVDEVSALIDAGKRLLVAGDEALLARLPRGRWIGGTIPYFVSSGRGVVTRERVYVDELPSVVTDVRLGRYVPERLDSIPRDRFDNGFSVLVVPATSAVHARFAEVAPEIDRLFDQPLVGWVSGVHLDDLGGGTAKAFAGDGAGGTSTEAVVLHAELPPGVLAQVDIVNRFRQGDGPALTFDATGFVQRTVRVDGVERDFAAYLCESGHDVRLPLVASYFGAMVNVSIQSVGAVGSSGGGVALYAPVFAGVEYRFAAPVDDFTARLPAGGVRTAFACSCILNFLYGELEGRRTRDLSGPATFGEIAYQLLNQTLVYLTIHE